MTTDHTREALAELDKFLTGIENDMHRLVDRHLSRVVNDFNPHGDDNERRRFYAVHNAIGIGPSVMSWVRLVRSELAPLAALVEGRDAENTRLREADEALLLNFAAETGRRINAEAQLAEARAALAAVEALADDADGAGESNVMTEDIRAVIARSSTDGGQ